MDGQLNFNLLTFNLEIKRKKNKRLFEKHNSYFPSIQDFYLNKNI